MLKAVAAVVLLAWACCAVDPELLKREQGIFDKFVSQGAAEPLAKLGNHVCGLHLSSGPILFA
jgi:hypothetical protein